MATHSRIFAWKMPQREKSGRLYPMGSQRLRHHWVTNITSHHVRDGNPLSYRSCLWPIPFSFPHSLPPVTESSFASFYTNGYIQSFPNCTRSPGLNSGLLHREIYNPRLAPRKFHQGHFPIRKDFRVSLPTCPKHSLLSWSLSLSSSAYILSS